MFAYHLVKAWRFFFSIVRLVKTTGHHGKGVRNLSHGWNKRVIIFHGRNASAYPPFLRLPVIQNSLPRKK